LESLAGLNQENLMNMAVRSGLIGLIGGVGVIVSGSQSAIRDWTVFLHQVGPLAMGTSISEARRVVGDPNARLVQVLRQSQVLPGEPDNSPCAYLATEKVPDQIGLMFSEDVWLGLTCGSPGSEHHYPPAGAHYMIFTPTDAADGDYQMLFETDGAKVTQFRVGLEEAVGQVEGCA
jgi:hypothetical protein